MAYADANISDEAFPSCAGPRPQYTLSTKCGILSRVRIEVAGNRRSLGPDGCMKWVAELEFHPLEIAIFRRPAWNVDDLSAPTGRSAGH